MKYIYLLTIVVFALLWPRMTIACGLDQPPPEWWEKFVLFPIEGVRYLFSETIAKELASQIEGSWGALSMVACMGIALVANALLLLNKMRGLGLSGIGCLVAGLSTILGIWIYLVRSTLSVFFC